MTKEYVCIVCPNSCRLTVTDEDGEIKVTGNSCKRGKEHGIAEFTNPMRMLTSTVAITGAVLPRLSVVSTDVVPRDQVDACLQEIYKVQVSAPIRCGDVIIENILNTGVNIVASKSMNIKE